MHSLTFVQDTPVSVDAMRGSRRHAMIMGSEERGYRVIPLDYPITNHPLHEELIDAMEEVVNACGTQKDRAAFQRLKAGMSSSETVH
jgi:hypothetical protein